MAGKAANLTKILMGGYDVGVYLRESAFSSETGLEDSETYGDSWRESTHTLKGGMMSWGGLWEADPGGDADAIDDAMAVSMAAAAKKAWTYFPEGDTVGNTGRGMNADQGTFEISGSVDGLVALSGEAASSVGLEVVKSLHALGAETGDANGTAVDNSTSTSDGGSAYLHVTAIAGTSTTLDITIEDSPDNSVWTTLATFTQVTTANASERITFAGTVDRYVRATWNLGATTTSATFQVAIHRD